MSSPYLRILFSVALFAACTSSVFASDKTEPAEPTPEQEKQFSEKMSDTTLMGRFTFDDKMNALPKPERYEIQKVSKLVGNLWTFVVRIKYAENDATGTVPITVPIVWADGTPMVSLKDAMLPGIGSGFSAHVIFEGDRYAGTWQHNSKGGHMFGVITKTADLKGKGREGEAEASVTPDKK